jgi:glycosyltransferase involved in cell wall biosynthesis
MNGLNRTEQVVSVVIPTYYRNDLLRQTLRSVLDQRYESIEVIVVDDSGEGHARPVADEFEGIEYIAKDENEGPQAARTTGIRASRGEFIQLLDDDDRLREEKIRKQVDLLNSDEEVGVVYCGFTWNDGTTVLPKKHVKGDVLRETLTFDTAPCITSTMLIK